MAIYLDYFQTHLNRCFVRFYQRNIELSHHPIHLISYYVYQPIHLILFLLLLVVLILFLMVILLFILFSLLLLIFVPLYFIPLIIVINFLALLILFPPILSLLWLNHLLIVLQSLQSILTCSFIQLLIPTDSLAAKRLQLILM